MATKLIELSDGVLVEAGVETSEARPISGETRTPVVFPNTGGAVAIAASEACTWLGWPVARGLAGDAGAGDLVR